MANALRGEATGEAGDLTLSLVMDNEAWVAIEGLLDQSYLDTIATLVRDEQEGRTPQNRLMRALLWGATRAHHGELTPPECGDLLMRHPGLHGALTSAVLASLPQKEPGPGEAGPPKAAKPKSRKAGAATGTNS